MASPWAGTPIPASPINKYLSSPGARGRGKWGVARRTLLVSFSQILAA